MGTSADTRIQGRCAIAGGGYDIGELQSLAIEVENLEWLGVGKQDVLNVSFTLLVSIRIIKLQYSGISY